MLCHMTRLDWTLGHGGECDRMRTLYRSAQSDLLNVHLAMLLPVNVLPTLVGEHQSLY